jgi:LysR family transcriptional regulator, low CO2-responsive transcriptional regulator
MIRTDTVTLRQLRALQALAARGGLTPAAADLGLSVPAVHNQIRSLEAGLGTSLVHRGPEGRFLLTPEGLAVLDAAQVMEAALRTCLERVEALRRGRAGNVVLGCVSTAKYFAPRLVAELKRLHPGIAVTLRIGNRSELLQALHEGSVEIAITGRPPREPAVAAYPLGPHPHLIVAAPDHPLAGTGPVTPARLLEETFIAREEGSGTRLLMIRYLDRLGDGTPYATIPMDSNETIKQAVMAGLGIAFISGHTVTEELRSGRLVALPAEGLPIERTWYLLHRQDLRMHAALETVIASIRDMEGRFLPS